MNDALHIADEKLAAFFDGELSPEEHRTVEAHVQTCAQCRRGLDAMAQVRRGLGALTTPAPADDLWARIEPALEPRPPAPRVSPRRWPQIAVAASVALLALALTVFALVDRNPPAEPTTALPTVSASAPFDQGLYLAALDHSGRLPALPGPYRQRQVPVEKALRMISRAAVEDLAALPASLELQGAYLIEKDGFRLAQLVFRHGESTVVVFCQPRSYAVSFSSLPAKPVVIDMRACLTVRCGSYRAYCFTKDEATYTVIGQHDDPVLAQVFQAIGRA